MIDLASVRADTPGVTEIVHLNNAGSALPPRQVTEAVIGYLRDEARMGGYEAQEARADDLAALYSATAEMLGCGTDEVAFMGGASEAWWRAFTSIPLTAGDRVLVGHSEFQANAFGLLQARNRGVTIDVVPNDERGTIDLDEFDRRLDHDVRLVCLTHVSMSNGAVHPAGEIGRRTRSAGIAFLLDSCQAAGQMELSVDALSCDFLVYTGRKFMRGPRGTGVLYARRTLVDELGPTPFVDGRSALWLDDGGWHHHPGAARFEFGEQNYAGKVGLAVATRYALDVGLGAIARRITELAAGLRDRLLDVPGVQVHDEGGSKCGIVTFTVDGHEPMAVQAECRRRGVNLSAPGRANAQWDLGDRHLAGVVRAGVHYYNTNDELEHLVDALRSI